MVRRRRRPHWHLALTVFLLLAAVAAAFYLGGASPDEVPTPFVTPAPPTPTTPVVHADAGSFGRGVFADVDSVLAGLGIGPGLVDKQPGAAGAPDEIRVRVPRDLPLASVNLHLTRLVRWHGGHVVRGEEAKGGAAVSLNCGIDSSVTTTFFLRVDRHTTRRAGRIALVIDAAAGEARVVERLCALVQPVTLVLRPEDARLAQRAADGGHEVTRSPPGEGTVVIEAGTTEGVRRQLWSVAERAADAGQVVALVPVGSAAVAAFESVLPDLERRGYRFLRLSELAP